MTDPTPHNDPDFDLARRIGEALEKGSRSTADFDPNDSFESALLAFKADKTGDALPEARSADLWTQIEQHTHASEIRPRLAVIRPLRSSRVWRSAAAVVILLGLIWFFSTRTPAPVLLAEADGTSITYTWPDGSTAMLRPHSRLFALASEDDLTRVQLEGEGLFDVTSNPNRTFSVEAGDGQIDVLGTRFNVSTWGEQVIVFLEEGRISFSNRSTDHNVILEPGQACRMAQGALEEPTDTDRSDYLDWTRSEMTFTERPLRYLLAELEHHYEVDLQVPATRLDETLTGRILLEEEAQSINDLGLVLGGQFVAVGTNTYRFESE